MTDARTIEQFHMSKDEIEEQIEIWKSGVKEARLYLAHNKRNLDFWKHELTKVEHPCTTDKEARSAHE